MIPIVVGGRVKITGLNSKPELNDTLARVISFNDTHQRWKVSLDFLDGKEQLMKPENLI